jgi:hypothetical protein
MPEAPPAVPAAPATEPAVTPGPKEFSPHPSAPNAKATLREAFEAKAAPQPTNRARVPEPAPQAALPTPPKEPDKAPDAKTAEKSGEPKPDGKDKLPPGRPIKPTAQETWKTLKSRVEQAEAKVKEYEANRVPEAERTTLTKRMEEIQRRNEELENHIRFKDYEQSGEFAEKYHKPYEEKFADAMSLFSRIPVIDNATGQQRAGNQDDLFELMNLDPVAADARALEMAGGKQGLADRLVAHAEKVSEVLKSRNKALEEAKVKGKEREQQMSEQQTRQMKVFEGKVKEWYAAAEAEWNKYSDAKLLDTIVREDGKELTPDEIEHNKLVEKGKELARWVSKHPRNAKTPEEAAEIVRRQTAILKRAIHFGPLRRLYKAATKKLAAAEAELAQFRGTTPTTAGRQPAGNGSRPGQPAKSGVKGMFDKYAGR